MYLLKSPFFQDYFIKETTVLEEKASNVRYLAKLRITANDRLLRQYLQEKNVPLVVASSADVMIVPVFREAEGMPARLWEEGGAPCAARRAGQAWPAGCRE